MINVATDSIVSAPWEGSGVAVENGVTLDARAVMQKANLDWEVEGRPLMTPADDTGINYIQVPSHKTIVRKRDNQIMGVVGRGWKILQNYEPITDSNLSSEG